MLLRVSTSPAPSLAQHEPDLSQHWLEAGGLPLGSGENTGRLGEARRGQEGGAGCGMICGDPEPHDPEPHVRP